jgi:hypothetical protein
MSVVYGHVGEFPDFPVETFGLTCCYSTRNGKNKREVEEEEEKVLEKKVNYVFVRISETCSSEKTVFTFTFLRNLRMSPIS